MPLLRSEALARVLAGIILAPEALNVREIANRAQLPYSVVQREVDRLESAGVVKSQRLAQARVVRVDENYPLLPEVRSLLLKAYGPEAVISDLLQDVEGIDEAYLFGSWAARYGGDWGRYPSDIDLLLIGQPDPRAADDISAEAEDLLGQPVQTVVLTPREWKSKDSGFARTVSERPLVRIEFGGE